MRNNQNEQWFNLSLMAGEYGIDIDKWIKEHKPAINKTEIEDSLELLKFENGYWYGKEFIKMVLRFDVDIDFRRKVIGFGESMFLEEIANKNKEN